MFRRRVALASVLVVPLVAGLTMTPAFGEASGTGATPTMTVSYRVSDIQFDGPDCVQVPFSVDYTIVGNIQGVVTVDLAYAGSSSKASGSVVIVASTDGPQGTQAGEISFCPSQYFSNKGPLLSAGTVLSPRANGVMSALTQSTVAVNRNPVRMSTPRVKQSLGVWKLSGRAVARTPSKGWIGADGKITIQVKKRGSSRWVSGEVVYPDEFGAWTTASAISTAVYPPGTRYRAVLTDCKWCTDATRSGVLR